VSEEKKRIWTISVWAVEADDKPMYEVPGTAHELPVEAMEVRHNETRLKLRGKVLCDVHVHIDEDRGALVVNSPDGTLVVVPHAANQFHVRVSDRI